MAYFLILTNLAVSEEQLSFNWKNSEVVVSEKMTKNGSSITAQYLISSSQNKSGYLISQTNINVMTFNGQTISEETKRQSPHLSAAFLIPNINVDQKGNIIEVVDFDGYLSQLASLIPNPQYAEALKAPQMISLMKVKSIERWCYWVCNWVDLDIQSDSPLIETTNIEIAGLKYPQVTKTEYHSQYGGSKNARIVQSTIASNEQFKESIQQLSKKMLSEFDQKQQRIDDMDKLDNVKQSILTIALVDPSTLKPVTVSVETSTSVDTPTGVTKQVEKKEFSFNWK